MGCVLDVVVRGGREMAWVNYGVRETEGVDEKTLSGVWEIIDRHGNFFSIVGGSRAPCIGVMEVR